MVPPKLKVGLQNWICSQKNISSFQYTKGKLVDPLHTHFANISCSSHWYLAIICQPASMLESQNSSAQEWYVIPLIYIHPRHSWYIYIALKSLSSTRLVLSIPKFMWSSPITSATKLAWGIDALTRVAWLCPVILRFDFFFPYFSRVTHGAGSPSTERIWLCTLPAPLRWDVHVSPNRLPETDQGEPLIVLLMYWSEPMCILFLRQMTQNCRTSGSSISFQTNASHCKSWFFHCRSPYSLKIHWYTYCNNYNLCTHDMSLTP